jgi:peroxiredoxin Q/BCP
MSGMLEAGSKAPDFSLPADDGSTVRLKDLKGQTVVVYFYPRDDTPGCTREACAFRDRKSELAKQGVKVLGISTDDVKSHVKFRDKFSLNFPLLADVDHKAAEAFGAWQEKNMYGKKSWGVVRSTFLIDGTGTIRKVWPKVSVDGHDEAVLEAIAELGNGPSTPTTKPAKTAVKKPAKKPTKKKK